jgi:hypothetical protein
MWRSRQIIVSGTYHGASTIWRRTFDWKRSSDMELHRMEAMLPIPRDELLNAWEVFAATLDVCRLIREAHMFSVSLSGRVYCCWYSPFLVMGPAGSMNISLLHWSYTLSSLYTLHECNIDCKPASHQFLACFTLWSWIWKRFTSPKRQSTFNWLHQNSSLCGQFNLEDF